MQTSNIGRPAPQPAMHSSHTQESHPSLPGVPSVLNDPLVEQISRHLEDSEGSRDESRGQRPKRRSSEPVSDPWKPWTDGVDKTCWRLAKGYHQDGESKNVQGHRDCDECHHGLRRVGHEPQGSCSTLGETFGEGLSMFQHLACPSKKDNFKQQPHLSSGSTDVGHPLHSATAMLRMMMT